MTSDFPPIGVVKGGDDVPNTQKSDPDDMQSMVRFLLYANEFDVEGLVASAGTFAMVADKNNILGVLDEYEKVYDNLKSYDLEYPSAEYLRSVTFEGRGSNHGLSITWGCGKQDYTDIIGEGLESEASNAIIAAADKPDPRPLWIGVWGGPREVAQAIWDVKNTRSEEELQAFISKLRVFLIYCQDASQEWLRKEFPDLFIIESIKTYQGMFGGSDPGSDLAWINENIRFNHGPLCDVYPHEGMGCTGVCEGDSPAFLYLVSANRGINDPEDPTQESWGGQYVRVENTNHFTDGPGASSISKWRDDYQKEFKERADRCIKPKFEAALNRPRVINTTDLGADPDDEQSMVRQLVCANEFDIEGLIVATGCWKKSQSSTAMLDKIVDAYGEVFTNLNVHADGYPNPEFLRSISVMGQTGYGMSDVGIGKDSPGSELIIASADRDDPRPVWVMGWGGMNNAAQAIWKVRETRSAEDLQVFLSKLRLYDILGQDDAGAWIAKNFPEVFYIRATGVYGWAPSDEYIDEHIQSHGPLGAVYPDRVWATEGDSPSFMHVYPNGLNDPEQIDQGGWGGRFKFTKQEGIRSMSEVHQIKQEAELIFDPYFMYGNTEEGGAAIKRWNEGYDSDFAARMDWSITSKYSDANHHPLAVLNGDRTRQVLKKTVIAGSNIELSAEGSDDPDGNELSYSWYFYDEPSSYSGSVRLLENSSAKAKLAIPEDAGGKTIHIILEVRDNGTPELLAYRRMVLNVQ
ncbi:MAG: nucleoside hydrolase-like domain-containing protein [Bacteroidota bacterium]